MNAIQERLSRINKSCLSTNSYLRFVVERHYLIFQTKESKMPFFPDVAPFKLFAVDLEMEKLVLDMMQTGAKSAHRKVPLDEIRGFYTYHESKTDVYIMHSFAVTHDQKTLAVSSWLSPRPRDLEEMMMVLGAICNKPVWRQTPKGETFPLEMPELLA